MSKYSELADRLDASRGLLVAGEAWDAAAALRELEAENERLKAELRDSERSGKIYRSELFRVSFERDRLRELLRDFLAETPECAWAREARAELAEREK